MIDWINFHVNSKTFSNYWLRSDFGDMAKEKQQELHLIWTFEEYEIEYIKYLIENGKAKPIPDIFDPYSA